MLYEKVMVGKKTTYRPFTVPESTIHLMDSSHLATLLSSLMLSFLMELESKLTPHSKVATEVKRSEESVVRMARLAPRGLDDYLVKLGTMAWNSAAITIAQGLARRPS